MKAQRQLAPLSGCGERRPFGDNPHRKETETRNSPFDAALRCSQRKMGSNLMNGIIYLVGLVVVVLAILSFLGMH
jgi:hypothetical protein